ncbi:MAG TPA: metallophosphoesterase [Caldilineaceae bacterium]|nr:metallophosphoesterase [Caldilineaceae bacterium]
MRIALLADIHGNMPALEAVLDELERLQPDYVLINGDLINGIPFSGAVVDLVQQHADWVVVRGNHEFYYLDFGTVRAAPGSEDPERWGQLHWLIAQISPEQGAYLAMLPDERTLYLQNTQPVRVAHGVPGRNRVGFYNGQAAEEIVKEIQMVPEATLISAHTHVQIDRHIRWDVSRQQVLQSDPHGSGSPYSASDYYGSSAAHGEIHRHWHLINPGSVGLPLNGRTTAQFALLENVAESQSAGGWQVRLCETPYDQRLALQAFHDSGMLTAGGVISELFYWEVVTAEAEIVYFYRWAWESGEDPDRAIRDAFQAYIAATGRDQYVRQRDPLHQRRQP